jgi:hypothetical protein
MRRLVREHDLVARLGGDEFAILQCDASDAEHVNALAASLVDCLSQPYLVGRVECKIGASVGVAIADGEASVEHMIHRAEEAEIDGIDPFAGYLRERVKAYARRAPNGSPETRRYGQLKLKSSFAEATL